LRIHFLSESIALEQYVIEIERMLRTLAAASAMLMVASLSGAQTPPSDAQLFERIESVLTHPRCLN
jgi:hypothetical protein